jgi:hypothetical protein
LGTFSEGKPIAGRATLGIGAGADVSAGVRSAVAIGLTYSTAKASTQIPTSQ